MTSRVPDDVHQVSPFDLIPTHGMTMSRRGFERLKAAIRGAGRVEVPVCYVVFRDGRYIVDGHHRVRAARQLGLPSVPAREVELPFRGYQDISDLFDGLTWID